MSFIREKIKTYREKTNTKQGRDPSLDNLRFLLIFLVVLAHFLEICRPFSGSGVLYKTVYSFHMPAFVFLFGYNVRFSPKRIVFRWFIPYLVFQSLYLLFAQNILLSDVDFQYTTPYWILWYMLACIFYQLLLPFYSTENRRREICTVILVVVIALAAGYDKTIGYELSLSRFLVFQPWFLMGYYCHRHRILDKLTGRKSLRLCIALISAVLAVLSVIYMNYVYPKNKLLYGSYSYEAIGSSAGERALIYLIALSWLCLLFVGIKPFLSRHIPLVTSIGQNTWPIFLAHGFVVRLAPRYFSDLLDVPAGVYLLTGAVIILTGNRIFRAVLDAVSLCWLEKLAVLKNRKQDSGENTVL